MKILTVLGSKFLDTNKSLFLYLNRLLKKAIPNQIIHFKFSNLNGRLKIQSCNYEAVKYAVVIDLPNHKNAICFDGLCKEYNYESKTTVSQFQGLYEGLR